MKQALLLRRLYDTLAPVDQDTLDWMSKQPINEEFFVEVNDLSKADIRRVCQNKLYWSWIADISQTDINEYAGWTKDEWHIYFKKEYLSKIYERDNTDYAIMMVTLRDVYRSGLQEESKAMWEWVINETSTTKAKVKQFSEYLQDIELFCHRKGIYLRTDPEIYKLAVK